MSRSLERKAACACKRERLTPKVLGAFGDGMEQEGEQIEGHPDSGEVVFAVAKINYARGCNPWSSGH
jgi:hypothetical protein